MTIILVPAYNEAHTIEKVVKDLLLVGDSVVVIDDGSTDNTAELAKNAGAIVLHHTLNRGQGAALETGQTYARHNNADFVVHFDADGQFDAAEILPALNRLKNEKVDVVFGSRFLSSAKSIPWFKRWILLPLGRLVDRVSGTVHLSDSHNGFRIFNHRALETICITQDRMAHATEIPSLVARHGLSWVEYPVVVRYDEFGQGPLEGVTIVRDLLLGKFL